MARKQKSRTESGIERSGGIIFLELQSRFGGSSASIAWTHSLRTTLRLLLGPLSNALSRRYTCRLVVMTGGVVFTIGMLLSAFTPNLPFLYWWFIRLRPWINCCWDVLPETSRLAVGLSTAGVGLGTFLVSPMLEILFGFYGFTGAFLVISSLTLHLCFCGSLYRPIDVHHRIQDINRRKHWNHTHDTQVGLLDITSKEVHVGGENDVHDSKHTISHTSRPSMDQHSTLDEVASEFKDDDKSPSIKVEAENTSTLMSEAACQDTAEKQNCKTTWRTVLRKIDRHLEFSLLRNIRFLCFSISILVFTSSFTTVYVYIPPLAKSCSIPELDAAYLISTAGILDIFGRTILSTTFDIAAIRQHREFLSILLLLTMSLSAVVSFTFTFVTTFGGLAVLAGLFGFLSGGYVSQKSIVIVDILGRSKQSSAFGLVLLFQGLGVLIGPPLAGVLADVFGHYKDPFYWCGSVLLFGSFISRRGGCSSCGRRRSDCSTCESVETAVLPEAAVLSVETSRMLFYPRRRRGCCSTRVDVETAVLPVLTSNRLFYLCRRRAGCSICVDVEPAVLYV
ncbi:hypothetical protein ScPMuIL_011163 [Solemya velum]